MRSRQYSSLPFIVPHKSDNMAPDEARPQLPGSSPGCSAKVPVQVGCHLKQRCKASKTHGGAGCGDQCSWCLQAGPQARSHAPGHSCQTQNGKRSMLRLAGIQQHLHGNIMTGKRRGVGLRNSTRYTRVVACSWQLMGGYARDSPMAGRWQLHAHTAEGRRGRWPTAAAAHAVQLLLASLQCSS